MSGDDADRYDVVVGRRVFSIEQKRAVVAEAAVPGVNVSAVARRHGIKPSLLFRWRRDLASDAGSQPPPRFLPVSIGARPAPQPASSAKPARIEIELAFGRKLRVPSDIDVAELRRIIVALETA